MSGTTGASRMSSGTTLTCMMSRSRMSGTTGASLMAVVRPARLP